MQKTVWGNRHQDWTNIQEATSKSVFNFVLDFLQINSSTTLLDIGCATGYFAKLANDRGATVKGLDATEIFIDEAIHRVPTASFSIGDMEVLPFKDNSFNVVCGFNSFQYAKNIENALLEARRVMTPKGKLVAMIWGDKEDCEIVTFLKAIENILPSNSTNVFYPFSLSENSLLEKALLNVGFEKMTTSNIISTWDYPTEAIAVRGLLSLGVVSKAIDENGIDKVRQVILKAIQPFVQSNGHIVYRNKYQIIISEK